MVVTLITNGSNLATYRANSVREMKAHFKTIKQWEDRIYEVNGFSYYVSGRNPSNYIKLKVDPNNGKRPFDDILPP